MLYCDFCGKSQREVPTLIGGPSTFICSECVDHCHSILHGAAATPGSPGQQREDGSTKVRLAALQFSTAITEATAVLTRALQAIDRKPPAEPSSDSDRKPPAEPSTVIGFSEALKKR